MADVRNATPLIALDAIVLDTETTGLDPRRARIVEIAAVRLAACQLDAADTFRSLVNPGDPIPASATAIHRIDDGMVFDAPVFAEVWPKFSHYWGKSVLIGHTVAFDVTMLTREFERAGMPWQPPRTLCTQLLARVVEPALADHSLESVAAWLDVEITDRHSALGDATTTARIFCALVPRLRERGVRTLGEAVRACGNLNGASDDQHRAGWTEMIGLAELPADRGSARSDSNIYQNRVSTIMNAPAVSVESDMALAAALEIMMRERISSVFVRPTGHVGPSRAKETGIVTERDLLRSLSTYGADALTFPVRQVMSHPLATVPTDAFAYLAMGRMNRLQIRHLGVTDDAGYVVGALSARSLLKLRAESGVELGDEIAQASSVHELGRAWAKLTSVATDLVREELPAREIAAFIALGVCDLTGRAAVLAEDQMKERGQGGPPAAYAFVVLGSAGRGESLLAMDQDNALIFADDATLEADRWFEALAVCISDLLHQVGIPYCTGGVMARNAPWRGSLGAWRERVGEWITRSNPADLLSIDIFFDLRSVHGDRGLAEELWRNAFDAARANVSFAKLLIEAAGTVAPSLGWFGGIKTEQGRIDLKRAGLFGIVSAARALAICHHVVLRSTPERLDGIKSLGLGLEQDLDALDDAQRLFLDLILRQQIKDIDQGRPATNDIEVKRLSRRDRERLRVALRAVESLEQIVHDLLFPA